MNEIGHILAPFAPSHSTGKEIKTLREQMGVAEAYSLPGIDLGANNTMVNK